MKNKASISIRVLHGREYRWKKSANQSWFIQKGLGGIIEVFANKAVTIDGLFLTNIIMAIDEYKKVIRVYGRNIWLSTEFFNQALTPHGFHRMQEGVEYDPGKYNVGLCESRENAIGELRLIFWISFFRVIATQKSRILSSQKGFTDLYPYLVRIVKYLGLTSEDEWNFRPLYEQLEYLLKKQIDDFINGVKNNTKGWYKMLHYISDQDLDSSAKEEEEEPKPK
ncbi:hypothetical protein SELMODRAFT_429570 [Selaginella moellendorffii]|uniref:Uncharacterized protein n=1 Tax=Selaginella moellendorffii TaxID=88036 RepID=D8T6L6_SELML|nr:hypothetical protein SELMODRAFT_429570 [Selaginella moellendorffii]